MSDRAAVGGRANADTVRGDASREAASDADTELRPAVADGGGPARRGQRAGSREGPVPAVGRFTGWMVLVAFVALVAVLLATLATLADPAVAVALGLAGVLGGAVLLHERELQRAAERRADRIAGLARILQGLSRSVSPDAVVAAIVDELRTAAAADHAVVVRRDTSGAYLEATLVAAGASVPASRTRFPAAIADPGGPRGTDRLSPYHVASAIAARVRDAYGLKYTLAAPLVGTDRQVLGALVLSRRTRDPWPAVTDRLLDWATAEVSAALSRAYAHEAATADARIDPLTGLPNRRYFEELAGILATGRRASDALGILMVDIDHFKRLNDRYGHALGDAVLRRVASAIVGAVRDEDTPARYGGEEFVVVLRRAGLQQAVDVAERLRNAVKGPWFAELGLEEPVTVSIGVAVADPPQAGLQGIVELADRALDRAKSGGRDRVVVA